jgi:hypothetical protein
MRNIAVLLIVFSILSCQKSNNKDTEFNILLKDDEIIQNNPDLQVLAFPRVMYVNAKEGLRVRSEPSIDSSRVGTFFHGERIVLYEKSDILDTIDGVENYWFQVRGVIGKQWFDRAWIFGGYLSGQLPDDAPVVIGYWDVDNDNRKCWIFHAHNSFMEGYKNSGNVKAGTWNLENNILTIISIPPRWDDPIDDPLPNNKEQEGEKIIIDLIINNRNDIVLNFQDGETIKLKRNFGL